MPDGTSTTGTDGGEGQQDAQQAGATGDGQQGDNRTGATGDDKGTGSGSSTPDFEAMYKALQGQARKWETRAKENAGKAKQWDDAEAANRTEAEQAADRAAKAEARAEAAVTTAVNAEIRAAARGWANPDDAPRYLDDKARYVGEDGQIDTTAIAADVAAVLKDRPHLAAPAASTSDTGRKGPHPDASQGARGSVSVTDQIRAAETKGDHREALRLKTTQLLGKPR